MTVAQINAMHKITGNFALSETKKVNLTMWRDSSDITLSFMNDIGEVWRYTIKSDGTWEGEISE